MRVFPAFDFVRAVTIPADWSIRVPLRNQLAVGAGAVGLHHAGVAAFAIGESKFFWMGQLGPGQVGMTTGAGELAVNGAFKLLLIYKKRFFLPVGQGFGETFILMAAKAVVIGGSLASCGNYKTKEEK